MTITAVKPVPTQLLAGSATALGTPVPSGVVQNLTRVSFANTDTSAHQVTVYCVPTSGSPGAGNEVLPATTIQPGQTYVSPELSGLNMIAGDQLYAFADTANKVNITASGVQFS